MRSDLSQTFEDFERVAEDYFHMLPNDTSDVKLDLCETWVYDDIENKLIFEFKDMYSRTEFYNGLKDSPTYEMKYEYDTNYEYTLTVVLFGKKGGLI